MTAADAIAIVGMAVGLPDAGTPHELHRNLLAGLDSVRPVPAERLRLAGADPGVEYQPLAPLRGVEEFDHEFFGISPREAELIDPQHRLALQLTCTAVADAGYSLDSLRGTAAALVMAGGRSDYGELLSDADEGLLSLLGLGAPALAGRIAYLLGTRGPALVLDTGCSTGLVAVDLAARLVREGTAPLAVVGGVSVRSTFSPVAHGERYAEVVATGGRCRAFDAGADGAGDGEGGVVFVLKTLEHAIRDRDHVRAVIRGAAVNHNGDRSNGMSAPSPAAQVELLRDAWTCAGARPDDIGYVEAHGSGTRLGDVIEFDGLRRAFAGRAEPCPIGSVKTNIGHLDHVAGLAGLAKVVVSLDYGVRYPSLHFERPNPLIEFDGAKVAVATTSCAWPEQDGPRMAGVSSFSLVGTNAHVVLAEPPRPAAEERADWCGGVATVSAKTWPALVRNCTALHARLADGSQPELDLRDVLHVLNRGRDHWPCRVAFPVTDMAELVSGLRRAARRRGRGTPPPAARPRRPVWLVSGAVAPELDARASGLAARFPEYARARAECASAAPTGANPTVVAWFGHRYALLRLVAALGADTGHVVGSRRGTALAALFRGDLDLVGALAQACADRQPPAETADLLGDTPVVLCTVGPAEPLLRRHAHRGDAPVVALRDSDVLGCLADLYVHGVDLDWERVQTEGRRVPLPGYQFEPIRCWVTPPVPATAAVAPQPVTAAGPAPRSRGDLVRVVREVWANSLKVSEIGLDSDYFDIGGTSVIGLQVLAEVRRRVGVRLRLPDLYAHRTVRDLAGHLAKLMAADEGGQAGTVVSLRAGDGETIICPHSSGGGVQPYLRLVDVLPAGYRALGVQAAGIDDGCEPDGTVEAMALRYATDVVAVAPEDPYHLFGWSMGGVIAFEMARVLRDRGHRVGAVVLVDANTELDVRPPPDAESELLVNLLSMNSGFDFDTAAVAGLPERARLRAVVEAAKRAGALPEGMTRHQVGALTRVLHANDRALAGHRFGTYPGPVHVVRARRGAGTGPDHRPADLGWHRFVGGKLYTHTVDGDHFTVMSEHHNALAAIFAAAARTPAIEGTAGRTA